MKRELAIIGFIVCVCLTFLNFFSSSSEKNESINYEVGVLLDDERKYDIHSIHNVDFEKKENGISHTGFYDGGVWTKITVSSLSEVDQELVIFLKSLYSVGYTFYEVEDSILYRRPIRFNYQDSRTYNSQHPNFEISLPSGETKEYYIYFDCDGRVLDASLQILDKNQYFEIITSNDRFHNIVVGIFGLIILFAALYYFNSKNALVLLFMLSVAGRFITHFVLNGTFFGLIENNLIVDHLVFIGLKMWLISSLILCARITELRIVKPRIWKVLRVYLLILVSLFIYQFAYYNSSIRYLHWIENITTGIGFLFVLLILLSTYKEHQRLVRMYFLSYGAFLVFGFVILVISWGKDWNIQFDKFQLAETGSVIEYSILAFAIIFEINKRNKEFIDLSQRIQNTPNTELGGNESSTELNQQGFHENVISILKSIESGMKTEEHWSLFIEKYKTLNPNFLSTLLLEYPQLTKSEIRLCLFLKLKFSHKEIAELLFITPETVKKYRYRIRKKFNLSEEVSIDQFISEL